MGADDRIAFDFHVCLGAGGYGEVYLATQHLQGGGTRRVAVKVLREVDDDSEAVKRMRDEGEMLAQLNHPVILQVHQFARVDGRLALVTEYVEGTDLSTFCTPPLLHPRVVFQIMAEVSGALDFAWRMNNPRTGKPFRIFHRDVKPDNIRVSREGEVRILDFGIARASSMKRHAKTAAGSVLMTPGYGAPESLTFGVSSAPVDMYALGVTLYEMLVGERLFQDKPLAYQASLAMDTVDYAEYIGNRLRLVELEPARGLLEGLFQHAPERRPSAHHVADFCEDMVEWLEGPTLAQWASRYAFPEVEGVQSRESLTGKNITVSGLLRSTGPQLRAPVTHDKTGSSPVGTGPAPRPPTPPKQARRTGPVPVPEPAPAPPPPPTTASVRPASHSAPTPPPAVTVRSAPAEPPPPEGEGPPWLLLGLAGALAVVVLILGAVALGVAVALVL